MQFLRVLLFGHIYCNLALGTFNIAIYAILKRQLTAYEIYS